MQTRAELYDLLGYNEWEARDRRYFPSRLFRQARQSREVPSDRTTPAAGTFARSHRAIDLARNSARVGGCCASWQRAGLVFPGLPTAKGASHLASVGRLFVRPASNLRPEEIQTITRLSRVTHNI